MLLGASVTGLLLVEKETVQVLARRFFDSNRDCDKLESLILLKLSKEKDLPEIFTVDEFIVQLKSSHDVIFMVVYGPEENDVLMFNFIEMTWRCLGMLIGTPVSRKKVLDHFDTVFLLLDEVVFNGIVTEDSSAEKIAARVEMRDEINTPPSLAASAQSGVANLDWKSMLQSAKGQLGSFWSSSK
jgi:Clathrin adaptor complex small chain